MGQWDGFCETMMFCMMDTSENVLWTHGISLFLEILFKFIIAWGRSWVHLLMELERFSRENLW